MFFICLRIVGHHVLLNFIVENPSLPAARGLPPVLANECFMLRKAIRDLPGCASTTGRHVIFFEHLVILSCVKGARKTDEDVGAPNEGQPHG